MKLTEMFPEEAFVVLAGQKYLLKYNTRAKLEIEKIYGNESEVRQALDSANKKQGMKVTHLFHILYACLVGAKNPVEKEILIDLMEEKKYQEYTAAVLWAFMSAQLTRQQLEMLEVIAEQAKKKEAEAQKETMPENGHGLESSAE